MELELMRMVRMAERGGFEPPVPLLGVHTISSRAPSTARSPLRFAMSSAPPALQFHKLSKELLGRPSCNLSERAVGGKDELPQQCNSDFRARASQKRNGEWYLSLPRFMQNRSTDTPNLLMFDLFSSRNQRHEDFQSSDTVSVFAGLPPKSD
jgi:hypothetical protein